MAIKVIVLGAEGLLGSALVSLADSLPETSAVGLDREACDVTDLERIREVCSILRPKVLINCAAWTAVDAAEADEARAMQVNGIGAGNVARVAESHDIPVVHISTDYIFDGTAQTPYKEAARPNPLSVYGRSKLLGEDEVKAQTKRHLIVRTGWLYGDSGSTFVDWILGQARAGEPLRVVDDQIGSPTCVDDLAKAILELVRQKRLGIVNASNRGQASWCGFARKILELSGIRAQVRAITSQELARPAPRPPYCVLDTTKLSGWIEGGMSTWEDALARFLAADDSGED